MFVPMMDFTQSWTDEKLYKHFGLTLEESAIIDNTMRPLVLEKDDVGKEYYIKYWK